MYDLISRQAAIDALADMHCKSDEDGYVWIIRSDAWGRIDALPSVQPTLYGYNIEHLELIARVLQKKNIPPERVEEALYDIGRIIGIVHEEFAETLRKAVERCTI